MTSLDGLTHPRSYVLGRLCQKYFPNGLQSFKNRNIIESLGCISPNSHPLRNAFFHLFCVGRDLPMDFEDNFDLLNEQGGFETNLDPFNLNDPVSSYLLLSDDVQDELGNRKERKMKCSSCGCEFLGLIGGYCPKCYSRELGEAL